MSGGVSAQRIRQSQNRALFVPGAKVNYTDVIVPVDVSYEFDVWGRIRRSVEAARADAQASAADLESVRLSLHAELALDYYDLRTTDAEVRLLRATVAAFERALQLTEERHRGGVASAADVAQAETQLALTRAQAIDLEVGAVARRTRAGGAGGTAAWGFRGRGDGDATGGAAAAGLGGAAVGAARAAARHRGGGAADAGRQRAHRRGAAPPTSPASP